LFSNDSPAFTRGVFVGECVRVPSLGNAALVQINGVSGRTVNVTTYYGTGVSSCNVPASGGVTVLPCTLTLVKPNDCPHLLFDFSLDACTHST
jgi:hypothetical protein